MPDTHHDAGYTLLSLLAGLALLGIMLPTALHPFMHWRDTRAVHQTAQALEQLLQQGMAHSMMTRHTLMLCGDKADTGCLPIWEHRFVLKPVTSERPLAVLNLPPELRVDGPRHLLYFQPNPFEHQASATFTLCGHYTAARIVINRTGRIRRPSVDQHACSPHT